MTLARHESALRRTVILVAVLNLGYFGIQFAVALAIAPRDKHPFNRVSSCAASSAIRLRGRHCGAGGEADRLPTKPVPSVLSWRMNIRRPERYLSALSLAIPWIPAAAGCGGRLSADRRGNTNFCRSSVLGRGKPDPHRSLHGDQFAHYARARLGGHSGRTRQSAVGCSQHFPADSGIDRTKPARRGLPCRSGRGCRHPGQAGI